MNRRVINRRAFLRSSAGAGVGAAAIGLVGCGDDDDDDEAATATATAGTATAAAAKPKYGGTLRHNQPTGVAPHLDPHTSSLTGAGNFSFMIYNSLLRLRVKDQLPEPGLAATMPEQPDKTTFIFKLRPGVKFHNRPPVNGRVVTAEDVVFTFERIRTPNDPTFINRSHMETVDKIEAVDGLTVKITTKQPDVVLLTILGLQTFGIVAREGVEKFGDLKSAESAIGTGPFVLDTYNRGDNIVFKRNPEYFREGLPYLDAVVGLQLGDPWSRFLAGDIHYLAVPALEAAGMKSRHPDIPTQSVGNFITSRGWMLNNQRMFKDIRLRRAMALLTNQKENLAFQNANHPQARMSICLGDSHEAWNIPESEVKKFQYYTVDNFERNAAEGLKLLEAAGFTASNPLQVDNVIVEAGGAPTGTETGDFQKTAIERYSKGAVKMQLRIVDYATLLPVWAQSQFDTTNSAWQNGPDPDQAIRTTQHTKGGRNYGRFSDSELDALIDKQRATFEFEGRKSVVQDIVRKIADLVPTVWLGYAPTTVAVQPNVHGFTGGDQDRWQLEETWLS